MVGEAEFLKQLKVVDSRPDPVVVVAHWRKTGDILDRLHTVGDPGFLVVAVELVLALPSAPVRAGLVSSLHDLGGHVGVATNSVTDHEGRHVDAVLVQQVENAWHALACPVFVERVLPQIGIPLKHRLGDRPGGAADRLTRSPELNSGGAPATCTGPA